MFSPLNRRQAVTLLGAGFLAKSAPEDSLRFSGIDHVAIAVSDAGKSAALYSRIFGAELMKESQNPRRYLKLGGSYLAIAPPAQGQTVYRVDHFCPGIVNYKADALKRFLDARGLQSRETALGYYVTDPDGTQIQLWTEDSWSQSIRTASPEFMVAIAPLFRSNGFDHLLIGVTDPDKSAAFYEKLFGPVTQRSGEPLRTWFQVGKSRIGLIGLRSGARPGVDHFCVAATGFDYATVTRQIEQIGAALQPPEVAGAPEFRDPDGILVQVMAPRA